MVISVPVYCIAQHIIRSMIHALTGNNDASEVRNFDFELITSDIFKFTPFSVVFLYLKCPILLVQPFYHNRHTMLLFS